MYRSGLRLLDAYPLEGLNRRMRTELCEDIVTMLSLHDTWLGAAITLEIATQFATLFAVALTLDALNRSAQLGVARSAAEA